MVVEETAIVEPPQGGVYVKGLFLEGAGWEKKQACLIEPQPMQLVCAMPLIHFKPVEQLKKKTKGTKMRICIYLNIYIFFNFRSLFLSLLLLPSTNWILCSSC